LIRKLIKRLDPPKHSKVVEIGGRYGFASCSLASSENLDLSYEVRCNSEDFLSRGKTSLDVGVEDRVAFTYVTSLFNPPPSDDSSNISVYVIRNLLWNWSDGDAVNLLQTLLPTLRANTSIRILVTDGVSPLPNDFPPHIEIGYRRRDITMMTMHNVKQRTLSEWLQLFACVDPSLKVSCQFATDSITDVAKVNTEIEGSSHVYKGTWELSLES
jgi:hypothetical protein